MDRLNPEQDQNTNKDQNKNQNTNQNMEQDHSKNRNISQNQGMQMTDHDFITEKIRQRPINKKKLLRRTVITAAMAAIFGLVACLTFLILEPVISNWLYPEEEPAPIVLPAETEEMSPEDMIVEEADIAMPEPPQAIKLEEEQIKQLLNSLKMDTGHYAGMYTAMGELAQETRKSVVTVTGSVSNMDWFNNPYESKDQTSGIIAAITSKEIYIVVNYEALEGAETLLATFYGGVQAEAKQLMYDQNTKLAIVAVAIADVDAVALDSIKTADLSGSSGSKALSGSPVIALGSPIGIGDSVSYGIVTSNSTVLHITDANYKLITTDIYGSPNASGVLVDLKGRVIGIIDNHYNSEGMENLVSALGISELRPLIEQLTNERQQAYLGTKGTDVPPDINESQGVPIGAYITEIEMDSPAMTAGIQSGDIVVQMGEDEINRYQSLTEALLQHQPEQTVKIKLMRQGPEEYMEMEVEVTLGKAR